MTYNRCSKTLKFFDLFEFKLLTSFTRRKWQSFICCYLDKNFIIVWMTTACEIRHSMTIASTIDRNNLRIRFATNSWTFKHFFYFLSPAQIHCTVFKRTARAQHISDEDGLHRPSQICKHLHQCSSKRSTDKRKPESPYLSRLVLWWFRIPPCL